MAKDSKITKDRLCKTCFQRFLTTAAGIKLHQSNCSGEPQ